MDDTFGVDKLMAKIAAFSFGKFQYPKIDVGGVDLDIVDYKKTEDGDLLFTVKVEGDKI